MHELKAAVIGNWGHAVYGLELLADPRVQGIGWAAGPGNSGDGVAELAEMAGVPTFEDYREILDREAPDVCAVMLQPGRAAGVVASLAGRGVHVISEKPIAGSRAGAEKVAQAVRKSGITYSACLPLPVFGRGFADAIRAAGDGRVGRPLAARFTYLATRGPRFIAEEPHYRDSDLPTEALSGGEVAMFGGYGVLALQRLMDQRIASVHSEIEHFFYDSYREMAMEDFGLLTLEFDGGAVGSMVLGRLPSQAEPRRIGVELTGTDGHLHVNGSADTVTVYENEDGQGRAEESNTQKSVPAEFVAAFVDCLLDGSKPAIDLQNALDTISVLEAAYRSGSTGKAEKVRSI